MLFANQDRYSYARSPLVEVICQLRFPAILSIGSKEPAEFQEAVRRDFPRYAARQEKPNAPAAGGEQPPAVVNYNFVSQDGLWKLNLTKDFIALSTLRYQQWEDFAHRLDKPLAQFIQIYQPAFFERIGLRYVNAFSRKGLGLDDFLWDDLITTPYLGVLGEPDVDEKLVSRSSLETEMTMSDGSRLKLHAGPGLLNGGQKDPEVKFILDGDWSVMGSVQADQTAGTLEMLHGHAVRLFRGAMTEELHDAMGPMPILD